jgi:hypothetical protein
MERTELREQRRQQLNSSLQVGEAAGRSSPGTALLDPAQVLSPAKVKSAKELHLDSIKAAPVALAPGEPLVAGGTAAGMPSLAAKEERLRQISAGGRDRSAPADRMGGAASYSPSPSATVGVRLSPAAAVPSPSASSQLVMPSFEAMDANHDGVVTKDEYNHAVTAAQALDEGSSDRAAVEKAATEKAAADKAAAEAARAREQAVAAAEKVAADKAAAEKAAADKAAAEKAAADKAAAEKAAADKAAADKATAEKAAADKAAADKAAADKAAADKKAAAAAAAPAPQPEPETPEVVEEAAPPPSPSPDEAEPPAPPAPAPTPAPAPAPTPAPAPEAGEDGVAAAQPAAHTPIASPRKGPPKMPGKKGKVAAQLPVIAWLAFQAVSSVLSAERRHLIIILTWVCRRPTNNAGQCQEERQDRC